MRIDGKELFVAVTQVSQAIFQGYAAGAVRHPTHTEVGWSRGCGNGSRADHRHHGHRRGVLARKRQLPARRSQGAARQAVASRLQDQAALPHEALVGLIPGSDHPPHRTIIRAHFRRQLKEMPWVTNPTRG